MIKLARLMPGPPQYFEPLRLALSRELLAGELELGDMPRLGDVVESSTGTVQFRLVFSRTDNGTVLIAGKFQTAVQLICQRCLESFELPVSGTIGVAIITEGAAAADVPADMDPLVISDQRVHLQSFIEDEILLELPMVPLHEKNACSVRVTGAESVVERRRPFAVLKDIKVK